MRTLKLVLERPVSRSRSANQKPPDATGKTRAIPLGKMHAHNKVGSRFELLKIALWHWHYYCYGDNYKGRVAYSFRTLAECHISDEMEGGLSKD